MSREIFNTWINDVPLTTILEDHKHWLDRDCKDWELMRADLHEADLKGIRFYHVDLRGANFRKADLTHSSFIECNLGDVDLHGANLSNTFFAGCDLHSASFNSATLTTAVFRRCNLNKAIFIGANLGNVLFERDNTCKLADYRRGKILTENIIGYKMCLDDVVVTLEIPRGAIVFSINGEKCRTNKAKVIAIDGADRAISTYKYMSYYVGDEFTVYDFNCEYNEECAEGIHFFMSREEAENYIFY